MSSRRYMDIDYEFFENARKLNDEFENEFFEDLTLKLICKKIYNYFKNKFFK